MRSGAGHQSRSDESPCQFTFRFFGVLFSLSTHYSCRGRALSCRWGSTHVLHPLTEAARHREGWVACVPAFTGNHGAEKRHAGRFTEAVDWAFLFANNRQVFAHESGTRIPPSSCKQGGAWFRCWTQWTQFGNCVGLEKRPRKTCNLEGSRLVAGACNHPNLLVLQFSFEILR